MTRVAITEFDAESINSEIKMAESTGYVLVDHDVIHTKEKKGVLLIFQEVTE